MLALQGTMYKILVFSCLLSTFTSGSKLECCKLGIDWIDDSTRCRDNNTVGLSCVEDSFAVDPNNDVEGFYHVNESNWLVIVDSENKIVGSYAPDKFCQAHLNNEVRYLICFPEEPSESNVIQEWRMNFFGICSILSGIFLAVTLLIYIILPELRDLQDKAIMSLCASFIVAFFISGIPKLSNFSNLLADDTVCVVSALVMYYSFLSAFFWLNVISLNIWRSVWFSHYKLTNKKLFVIYCALGWGVPLCFLALTITAQYVDGAHIKPGLGVRSCWFNGYSATLLYFYVPILVLLLLNLVYLGLTSWKLWHKYETFDCSHAKVLKTKCMMCLKLSLLMGATWIFEIISFVFEGTNQLIWFLPDFLNALQGLIIFIFFVASRTKVKKLLAEHRPCSIPFPKSWAAYKDHEKPEENYIDELRLSHTT